MRAGGGWGSARNVSHGRLWRGACTVAQFPENGIGASRPQATSATPTQPYTPREGAVATYAAPSHTPPGGSARA